MLSAVRLPEDLATATARGQYGGGWQGGEKVLGFLEEAGMNPESTTETFAAIKLDIATRRWQGVPVLPARGQAARPPRHRDRDRVQAGPRGRLRHPQSPLGQNALVIRVQPDEGVTLRFGSKVPGVGTQVRDVTMDFGYGHAFTEASPEAYERLILDVLLGDPPLFPRHPGGRALLEDPRPDRGVLGHAGPARAVPSGTWGPASADDLLARRPDLEASMKIDLPDTTVSRSRRPWCTSARRAAPSPSAAC